MSIAVSADYGWERLPEVPLSVEKYHEMAHAGIIGPDDRLELLEGMLVKKMTISPAHRKATYRLRDALMKNIPAGWYVDSQVPITLSTSEPEPDAFIARGSSDDFGDRHPGPADLALVAEVADSSMFKDRVQKKSIYAGASIEVYWIVNLIDRRVEVYSGCTNSESGDEYTKLEVYGPTANVPLVIEGQKVAEIAVRELLP